MIKPVNGHLLIEPIPYDAFMASERETYQEIGVVVSVDELALSPSDAKVGDKVYFDAWLAAKFPKDKDSFYWLVKWEDIRAVEHAES
jgi:co-chaperonin GroES (HSP10)